MPIIPQTIIGRIEFFEQRLPIWASDPTAVGLQASDIVALGTLVTDARAKYELALASRNTAKANTLAQNDAVALMLKLGSDTVQTISVYAEKTNNPNVYVLAQIPPRAEPTPTPPPAQPQDLVASINNFGTISLSWKASRAVGTQFIIQRQMVPIEGSAQPWTAIGTSTTLDYNDEAVPVGFRGVNYRVYAQRASGTSNASTTLNLIFGNIGSQQQGQTTLTIAA